MLMLSPKTNRLPRLLAALAAALSLTGSAAGEEKVTYRDVRPILSEYCFACHGPDEAARKAKLRLDLRDDAVKPRDDGPAIAPHDPKASLILQRINSPEPDEAMPPRKLGKKLKPEEIAILTKWIEQGAEYPKAHWSFVPPTRPQPPKVKNETWARNPIDRFILAELEQQNLSPAPEADRRTLARRVALDLTGLPPVPADVEAFVNDESPDAYEKFIDKYLAKPEWGEHRARYWLDAARYADTHGIHIDNYREMWHYRQWVIEAFNRNEKFDTFVIEQLAGDMLPKPTLEQKIASGFQRCNITTSEGGSINDEVLANYAKDRVETFGTVFLGLTVGCAACHDHKFDPITQKEFYQLTAFFRNTTQPAMDGNIPDTPPILIIPSDADRPRYESAQSQIADLKQQKTDRLAQLKSAMEQWLTTCDEPGHLASPIAPQHALFSAKVEDNLLVSGSACGDLSPGATLPTTLPAGIESREGRNPDQRAFFFKEPATLDFPIALENDADRPLTLSTWVRLERLNGNYVLASRFDGAAKEKRHGWKLEINNGTPILTLLGNSAADAIALAARRSIPEKQWAHLLITYDGSRTSAGFQCFVNGKEVSEDRRRDGSGFVTPAKTLEGSIRNDIPLRLGGDGAGNFKGNALAEFTIYNRDLSPEEADALFKWDDIHKALLARDDKALDRHKPLLAAIHAHHFDDTYPSLSAAHLKADSIVRQVTSRSPITHVMNERMESKPTARILFRGAYDQPRDEVQALTPAVLHEWPADAPGNRLGLAHWLFTDQNPLTARVTVNRFWQQIFGAGLVRSSEDFGITGEAPSHPELLDYLAVEFRESGWDIKHLFRTILTSAAYRQSALVTPEKLEKDPANRLLSRGPRFRMDAEMIRDAALAASGLLVRKIGGPSVRTYQPDNVWEAVAMFGSNTRFYKRDSGDALYRRSLYWFWKRSAPPASMEIFNAPSREVCTVRRERGNNPLQALVTMNDVQFVEAARVLAQAAMSKADDPDARLDFITASILSRPFDDQERAIALASLARFWSKYQRDEEAAKKLITYGESKPDEKLPATELAAWTLLASQIMNMDEALNK